MKCRLSVWWWKHGTDQVVSRTKIAGSCQKTNGHHTSMILLPDVFKRFGVFGEFAESTKFLQKLSNLSIPKCFASRLSPAMCSLVWPAQIRFQILFNSRPSQLKFSIREACSRMQERMVSNITGFLSMNIRLRRRVSKSKTLLKGRSVLAVVTKIFPPTSS